MFELSSRDSSRSHQPVRYLQKYATITVALFAFTALLSGCRKTDDSSDKPKRPLPLVVVAAAVRRDVPVELDAPVDLRPLEQVDVSSKVLGYLDAVLVERGDRVRKGQPIALVRPSDLPDQLAAARSNYAQVQTSSLLAKSNYERAVKLQPAGVLSQQELDQSKTAMLASESAESTAKAQLEALAVRVGETRITSPIDGLVAARKLDPGALVSPTGVNVIATIMRVDRLRAYVTVVERYATAITVGMPARVVLDAAADEPFTGTVVRVSPAVDPNTRTLEAEVQIENREGRLRPGMYGRGYIRIGLHEGATVVPINSVDFGGKIPHVLVAAGDRVTRRNVTIGTELDRGSYLEILDGVSPGELVVIAGADGLTDGSKVRIQKERTESGSQKGGAAPSAAASPAAASAASPSAASPSAASPSPVSPVTSNHP